MFHVEHNYLNINLISLKMKNERITKKKKIHSALYVMECPHCGIWVASASDYNWLPAFTYCHCLELSTKSK